MSLFQAGAPSMFMMWPVKPVPYCLLLAWHNTLPVTHVFAHRQPTISKVLMPSAAASRCPSHLCPCPSRHPPNHPAPPPPSDSGHQAHLPTSMHLQADAWSRHFTADSSGLRQRCRFLPLSLYRQRVSTMRHSSQGPKGVMLTAAASHTTLLHLQDSRLLKVFCRPVRRRFLHVQAAWE